MIWFYPITSYSVLFAEDHKANAQYISTVACSDTVDKTLSYYYCSALDNTVSYCADPQHTLDITGIPGAYNVILTESKFLTQAIRWEVHTAEHSKMPLNVTDLLSSFMTIFGAVPVTAII